MLQVRINQAEYKQKGKKLFLNNSTHEKAFERMRETIGLVDRENELKVEEEKFFS